MPSTDAPAAQAAGPAAIAVPDANPALTTRAFVAGSVLAVFLCGVNSYLTLSFGVIEEGPTIAALFFFAFFFLSKTRIKVTELVVVATMGSAGGSLGFITNFYAARAMVGTPYTFWEMAGFAVVTSMVGMAFVIPLRELLILRENLPWPGSKATASVITALSSGGDRKQPLYLLVSILVCMAVVLLNTDGGFGVIPDATELPLFGLAAYGAAIAWSPFAIGGAYLMGFRTCVGFLFGGVALLAMAPHLPDPSAPHRYVWPGIAFLVASGVAIMLVNWRVIVASLRSLLSARRAVDAVDDDPIMAPRQLGALFLIAASVATLFLVGVMGLSVLLVLVLVVVAGFLQNVIATRAAAMTAFNPARVMGVLLEGVSASLGASAAATSLTGAGFVAGSGAQAGNLTGDLAYGRWFRVPARWQFWTQFTTLVPCALVSAWVFTQIQARTPMTLDSAALPAPVAKMWAASAMVFDPALGMGLPDGAVLAMVIAAIAGVVWVVAEHFPRVERVLPSSIGFGLGLVLPVAYDFAFFLGGVLLWLVLGRGFKVRDLTLTTIAVGAIVAEGLGGVLKPVLQMLGLIAGAE